MVYQRPPRGYAQSDQPLPHNFSGQGGLGLDGTSKTATYIPIIMNDKGLVNADLVIANNEHGSFAESPDCYCYKNSIIPKIMFSIKIRMSKVAVATDALRDIVVNWMPVYTSFKSRLDAEDTRSGSTCAELLELVSEAVGKSVRPIWTTVSIDHGADYKIHTNATTALMGLTGDDSPESVAFDPSEFYDAMHYYSNRNMLKKMVGENHKIILNKDKTYSYYSNNFTNSMVKRINDYTWCGILIWTKKSGQVDQIPLAADTTDINHIDYSYFVRYNEWNQDFDQTAT